MPYICNPNWLLPHAPDGKAWYCPDCDSWATLGENAWAHAAETGHDRPDLKAIPERPDAAPPDDADEPTGCFRDRTISDDYCWFVRFPGKYADGPFLEETARLIWKRSKEGRPDAAPQKERVKCGCGVYHSDEMACPGHDAAPPIEVVAAVRRDGDCYWVCRRTDDGSHGGLAGMWEYPGGKVEQGETQQCALIREMREEFNVEAVIGKELDSVTTQLWDKRYRVTFFAVEFDGEPELRCHDATAWCTVDQLLGQHHLPSGTIFNSRLHDAPPSDAAPVAQLLYDTMPDMILAILSENEIDPFVYAAKWVAAIGPLYAHPRPDNEDGPINRSADYWRDRASKAEKEELRLRGELLNQLHPEDAPRGLTEEDPHWPYIHSVDGDLHRNCGGQLRYRVLNSDHDDRKYRCDKCEKTWVEEGPDA